MHKLDMNLQLYQQGCPKWLYFITTKGGCPPRYDDVLLGTLSGVAG